MVGSVVCFSIMDICVKWLDYYPVGQVLFLRFFIGFIPIKPKNTADHLFIPTFSDRKKIEATVTNIGPPKNYVTAEPYHQKYIEKNRR